MTMDDYRTSGRLCSAHAREATTSWRTSTRIVGELFHGTGEAKPARGEIWTVQQKNVGGEQALLAVVLAASGDDVAVIPLSEEVHNATEWDLLVPPDIMGYAVIAQIKLAGTITAGQLEQRLSSLPAASLNQLEQMSDAAEHSRSVPPEELPVGPWVLSEADKRLEVRRQHAQRLVDYLTPSYPDPTAEWHSFGSILTRSALATGIAVETMVDKPADGRRLQHDEMDLLSELPARRLAALLVKLQVRWTERLRDALYQLAFDRYHPSVVVHGVVLGRRRGRRSRHAQRPSGSDAKRKTAVDRYIREVERELEE
jgi:hypothetical protein